MSPTVFRLLVIASIVLGVAGGVLDLLFPDLLSPALAKANESEPLPDLLEAYPWLCGTVIGALTIAYLAGIVGLLFFKRWAPPLALWCTLGDLLLAPLVGATVASGWSSTLAFLSYVSWGAALALAYHSPIAARFGRAAAPP